jgi:DNA-binding response OmpR family regulator
MKVLVIDGERTFLRVMRAPLERGGHKVLAVQDGLSGLALVRSEPLGLVLLNVMPLGLDVCRQLRQISDVPIIMYGSPKPEDVVGALAAGADDYVLQPFSQHELLARVHALLRRAAWQRQAQAVARVGFQQSLTAFSRNSQPVVVSWDRRDQIDPCGPCERSEEIALFLCTCGCLEPRRPIDGVFRTVAD